MDGIYKIREVHDEKTALFLEGFYTDIYTEISGYDPSEYPNADGENGVEFYYFSCNGIEIILFVDTWVNGYMVANFWDAKKEELIEVASGYNMDAEMQQAIQSEIANILK